MYTDIPTLDQWKKDTTVEGKRDLDVLAWIDEALEDWEKAKSDKDLAGNKKVLQFLLLCLGYQVMRGRTILGDSSPQKLKSAINDHYDIISSKLKNEYSIGQNEKIDDVLTKKVATAMTQHGIEVDSKYNAHYLNSSNLWQRKVYSESAALRQYAWWDESSPPNKSSKKHNACTLEVGILRLNFRLVGDAKVDPSLANIQAKEIIVAISDATDVGKILINKNFDLFCGDDTQFTTIGTEFVKIVLTDTTRTFVKIYIDNQGTHYIKRNSDNTLVKTTCDEIDATDPSLALTTYSDMHGTYREYIFSTGWPWEYVLSSKWPLVVINGWRSPYGSDILHWAGYVLGADGELYMTRHSESDNIFHSCYFAGKPILTAGTIMVDPNGHLVAITNCSGHYKPAATTLLHVLKYFKLKNISLANVIVGAYNAESLLKFYFAEDFLKSHGRCAPLRWDEDKEKIRDHIYKNRGPYTAPNGRLVEFNNFEFEWNMGIMFGNLVKPAPTKEVDRCLKVFGRLIDGKYDHILETGAQ